MPQVTRRFWAVKDPLRLNQIALEATWRSGDAADCKSANPGSIPGVASTLFTPRIFYLGGRISLVKCLLTLDRHHVRVFLEDTPPLPNALGPGSHPASFFCPATSVKFRLQGGIFPLVLAQGTR